MFNINDNSDIFDNDHVFVVNTGEYKAYIPFRNISHVFDNGYLSVVMNNGASIMINEVDAWEFMQEYKGCVGLPLEAEDKR